MYRILIVEDDGIIAGAMEKHLSSWGYQTRCVRDFAGVMHDFVEFDPQLVLLDVTLPSFNGYHWCGEIRRVSKAPVIFISSASDNMNIVMAMNLGGDDFIAKPFDLHVLTAKVQALLRRSYDFAGQSHLMQWRGAILNTEASCLTYQEKRLELTKNENRILQVLLENKGRTVSRDRLMERLWDSDSFVDDNTLTVNITRLRRKLAQAGLSGMIVTRKGEGYRVEDVTE
ncbi:MAG: response regulator transcription factor [Lachnospiraceae bacterium]|nr:response regulator transcription factor [Lachnospiraceae bacterium]